MAQMLNMAKGRIDVGGDAKGCGVPYANTNMETVRAVSTELLI